MVTAALVETDAAAGGERGAGHTGPACATMVGAKADKQIDSEKAYGSLTGCISVCLTGCPSCCHFHSSCLTA
jgi:hypothetical protein